MNNRRAFLFVSCVALLSVVATAQAQRLEIPRRHDKPPGPPITAQEAVERMVVPEGFTVEIVAAEPDVVNPVAMFIDEKGRFWITESFEYPRREPGPGKDRIKVLEDTDGDGKVDKTTIFAEGLNIPSGIAVGYGGVWVANSPDILFLQDTDGDLKADKTEVVVTGFGRTDTHELPNSFTWGPDGWLYGLNGVFNYCNVKYAPSNPNYDADHPGWKFTCAMWRIHPRTREFQIFAEGTSNPWGIAFNDAGEAFISACVIDHLWHIVESAYYIRQGGPYPPHTWPMESIVNHTHQKAAYCGITWFDSDAYPEEYRNVLYMGNIHGGCINADIAQRSGSTYKGKPHPGFPAPQDAFRYDTVRKIGDGDDARLADFLTANDAWFMPVVQTTGPDGCLYVLDWYDRYHCYQDANADPAGIERARGRLYRVLYKGHEHKKFEDLSQQSEQELLSLLDGGNQYARETARRLLSERVEADSPTVNALFARVQDEAREDSSRLRALWTLAGIDGGLTEEMFDPLVMDQNPLIQSWGLRLAGNREQQFPGIVDWVSDLVVAEDVANPFSLRRFAQHDPRVLLQLAVLRRKNSDTDDFLVPHEFPIIGDLSCLGASPRSDALIRHVVWQNLVPLLTQPDGVPMLLTYLELCEKEGNRIEPVWLPRVADIMMSQQSQHADSADEFAELIGAFVDFAGSGSPKLSRSVLRTVTRGLQEGHPPNSVIIALRERLGKSISDALSRGRQAELFESSLFLGGALGVPDATGLLRQELAVSRDSQFRLRVIETLIAANDQQVIGVVREQLSSPDAPNDYRAAVIGTLGRVSDPQVADVLLEAFGSLEPNLQPKVIEVLTQRDQWSIALLKQIEAKAMAKELVNLNQLKRVASFPNAELKGLVSRIYGAVRADRRSDRQHVINFHRDFLRGTPGDPFRGAEVFKKVCAQCHKMHGDGAEVGPDITRNGRNNWEQLLQNVFDPSAVIGPGYQARILATVEGRVLTGLPVEESDERIVLKVQGGKIETIPRSQIEIYKVSEISMMPEDLEKATETSRTRGRVRIPGTRQAANGPDRKDSARSPRPKTALVDCHGRRVWALRVQAGLAIGEVSGGGASIGIPAVSQDSPQEASAGECPGDMEAVAPEDLTAEADLADRIQTGNRLTLVVDDLAIFCNRGSTFGRCEVGPGGTE